MQPSLDNYKVDSTGYPIYSPPRDILCTVDRNCQIMV